MGGKDLFWFMYLGGVIILFVVVYATVVKARTKPNPKPSPLPPHKPEIPCDLMKVMAEPYEHVPRDGSYYSHVINAAADPVLDEFRFTNAHETTHRILAYYLIPTLFYDRKYLVLRMTDVVDKRKVVPYVPIGLRKYRFNLYVERYYPTTSALYIVNELCCYYNGLRVMMDDVDRGLPPEEYNDYAMGVAELLCYSIAAVYAIIVHDPSYDNRHIACLKAFFNRCFEMIDRSQKYRHLKDKEVVKYMKLVRKLYNEYLNS